MKSNLEGAAVAVKEMRVSTPCDVLAVLWELRRVTGHAGSLPNCRCYAAPALPD